MEKWTREIFSVKNSREKTRKIPKCDKDLTPCEIGPKIFTAKNLTNYDSCSIYVEMFHVEQFA